MLKRANMLPLICALFLCSAAASSQQPENKKPSLSTRTVSDLERIQSATLASDYAYRQLEHLTDSIGPRLSGSAQAAKAVEYVAGEMRRLGMSVELEKLSVPHWVRGEEIAALVEFPGMAVGTSQKLVLTALGGSVPTPQQGLTAEVVVVKSFDELNALGRARVEGKIVVFTERFDRKMAAEGFGGEAYREAVVYRALGASAAARLGAVACVVRSAGGAEYRLPHTGALRYQEDVPKIPAAALAAEDADMIERLSQHGTIRIHLTLTPNCFLMFQAITS